MTKEEVTSCELSGGIPFESEHNYSTLSEHYFKALLSHMID